ncbi:bacteriocin [Neisseria chenwenguii]|uniref:Uncharacterized protein n=1 Tax=Neisseria chenwenguii TaxID=1853278 RepID=A0A220S1L8_9NEIS|nr:bacteriocin [Neisseria chenwenguii]ASK27312.1 hypothetical protein BG910_05790 [Neisseria chenwenguii]ROV57012.1 bacteriocin [Neisseria chenwenguii]
MKTLTVDELNQVSGGFDIGKTIASDVETYFGGGTGVMSGYYTGAALGTLVAGPAGIVAGGAVGAAVGGYLGGKLGSVVLEKSFGY